MADTTGSNGGRIEFNAVGKPNIPGKVSHSLATGSAKFGTDIIVPNMLHAKFLRSPHARAQVKSIDTSKAKALPGVVEVITWDDPELKALGGGAGIGGAGGGGMIDEMGAPMLDDIADMEDQEVGAIVVAESEDLCDEALRLLKEEFVFDQKTGVKLHTNMFEYRKPTIVDIGKVESHLLETRAGNAAYGANGISHSLANTHAIICAIQNAIGKWVDPPATPDKILKALSKA